ncbi:FlgD immunoglobulin-like domain containing protein [Candidatus Cloacimonadota bacterium]
MKKTILFVLSILLITALAADDVMMPVKSSKDFQFRGVVNSNVQDISRYENPAPTFAIVPNGNGEQTTYLYDSYYDYMPYSYSGFNVQIQPEISMPYGYNAGGMYISYMVSETPATGTDRRAYNSYVNPDGTLFGSSATNHYDVIREGYTSVDIDPVTADPLFAWHAIVEDDNSYDCIMTYDNYHLTGATGYWKQPWILFDNPELGEGFTGHTDDEFIWPVIMIGDSPLENSRRVHAYGNNFTLNEDGYMFYNSVYGYADFNEDDLLFESEFEWTYRTFPVWDENHYSGECRTNKDMLVKDNKVAFIGCYDDTLFCYYSEDFGETFTIFTQEWLYPIENPLQEDGVTYEFLDDDGVTPSEMYWCLSNDGSHFNGVFTNDDSKIVWMTGINLNSQENRDQDLYMAAYFYPKIFSFDIGTGEFDFYDMDIQGVDPTDDLPAIPWDLDEDGIVDDYYTDGEVYIPLSMASYFFNADQGYQDSFFHESYFRMVTNENDDVVVIWQDCKKARLAYFETEGYDGWFKQPEIMISASRDGGMTWSEPLVMNANPNDNVVDPDNNYENHFVPEFDGMLPVYFAISDKLEDLGDNHVKFHTAFFDDNDYGGAAAQSAGSGELNGGILRYMALDLDLGMTSSDDTTIPDNNLALSQNYPNPFNPSTRIDFQIEEAEDVSLEVFNIKGQKVKTLVNGYKAAGDYSVEWNGINDEGKSVTSGIYFYRLSSKRFSSTRKMILLQ